MNIMNAYLKLEVGAYINQAIVLKCNIDIDSAVGSEKFWQNEFY